MTNTNTIETGRVEKTRESIRTLVFENLIDFAVRHARCTALVIFAIVLFGVIGKYTIPIENEPSVEIPHFVISVAQQGISPDDAVSLLITPLEQELKNVEGVKEITGTATENAATVAVEFKASTDIDDALNDLREAVNRAKERLPSDAHTPEIQTRNTASMSIMQINLVGTGAASEQLVFRSAQDLKRLLEDIHDVQSVEIQGSQDEFLELTIDPQQMHAYSLSVEDLIHSLQRNNRLIAAGSVKTSHGENPVIVENVIDSTDDLLELPVRTDGISVVTLADVAIVQRTFKDRTSVSKANGETCISLFVYKRDSANMIETAGAVEDTVREYRSDIPTSIKLFVSQNSADFAEQQVSELQGNIVTALLLVMLAVMCSLGMRSSVVVGSAIPVSFLFALCGLWMLGYSFNFMVMFGMLLSLGMLIDGVIVVTEDAERRMDAGQNAILAYTAAAKRMFVPVGASIATTVAAFLPLLFWPGTVGEFMKYLPVTLCLVMTGALVHTLLFVPLIGSSLARRKTDEIKVVPKNTGFELVGTVTHRFQRIYRAYAKVLSLSVRYSFVSIPTIGFAIWAIFAFHGHRDPGVIFFNESDPHYAQIFVRARGNLDIQRAYELVTEVESEVLQIPGIENLNSFIKTGSEASEDVRVSYADGPGSDIVGMFFLELYGQDQRTLTGNEILQEIRDRTSHLSGIVIDVVPYKGALLQGKPIAIQFTADEHSRIEPIVRMVRWHMEQEMEGLRDIEDTLPIGGLEWELTVDKPLAAMFGADVTTVGLSTQLVTKGVKLGEYRPSDAQEPLDIRIRYPVNFRGLEALDQLEISTKDGVVPISHFVERLPKNKTDVLQRRDQSSMYMIRAGLDPDVLADTKVRELKEWISAQQFDPFVEVKFVANEEQNESFAFVVKAFSFALFLVFTILVLQFNSFYQALVTLLAIVLSIAGVFLGLSLTNQPFSVILSSIGILALAGIVVNNNIVLIDTFNILRRENPDKDVVELAIEAGVQRLRPVLLTMITTIVGLLPLATHNSIDFINRTWVVGGEVSSYWVPLAQAIVFGLSFATILTLLVTPALLVLPLRIGGSVQKFVIRLRHQLSTCRQGIEHLWLEGIKTRFTNRLRT